MAVRLSVQLMACLVLVVAVSSASATAAAPVATKPPRGCEVRAAATSFIDHCASGGSPSQRCCDSVLNAAEHAGLRCLCWVAAEPSVRTSGYDESSVLATYASCGGHLAVEDFGCTDTGSVAQEGASLAITKPADQHHRSGKRVSPPSPPTHHRRHRKIRPARRRRRRTSHKPATPTVEDDAVDEDDEHDDDLILQATHHEHSGVRDKLEVAGIIMVIVVVPTAVLSLVCYIVCAGAGNRVARARLLLDLVATFLPHVLGGWRGGGPGQAVVVDPYRSAFGVAAESREMDAGNSGALVPATV